METLKFKPQLPASGESHFLSRKTAIFSTVGHPAEMASTLIWAERVIPTQKEYTISDPTGSWPTCETKTVRIMHQSAG
jgi:hypothetical protein